MKVLLATDGSPGAAIAETLVGSLRWQDPTEIVVLRIAFPIFAGGDVPPDAYTALHEQRKREANEQLGTVRSALARAGVTVETRLVLGRAGSVIVDEARRLRADLIVVGSRGLGPFKSAVLGSVAAEVVDHAPCPVLVARSPVLTRIVLAADGSSEAALAEALIREWPVFRDLPVNVVIVAAIPPMVSGSFVRHEPASAAEASAVDRIRAVCQRIGEEAVARLERGGVRADASVRGGDPAHQLIEAASDTGADLIVSGSRGATGLERLVLGSVARGILHHAPCSVLIARRASELSSRANAVGGEAVTVR